MAFGFGALLSTPLTGENGGGELDKKMKKMRMKKKMRLRWVRNGEEGVGVKLKK